MREETKHQNERKREEYSGFGGSSEAGSTQTKEKSHLKQEEICCFLPGPEMFGKKKKNRIF